MSTKTRRRPAKRSATPPAAPETPPAAQDVLRVTFDDRNANRHDDRSLGAVSESVKGLGAGRSIVVDRTGKVIGGEATLRAAQEAGLELEYVRTRGDKLVVVVREDLGPDDPKRTALAIADNKTSKLSDFDYQVVSEQLRLLSSDPAVLQATGFTAEELRPLLDATWVRPPSDSPLPDGTTADMGMPIRLTMEQRGIADRAIARVRERESDPSMSEGRCVELICADFLAGPSP